MADQDYELQKSICVIGAGAAGLITAHVLLKDGFTNVEVLTRDKTAGGVWAKERVYPGLALNNVHGEFNFSPLPMPLPKDSRATGGRLTGEDMQGYMESFAEHFLKDKIRYQTEITHISRADAGADERAGNGSNHNHTARGWTVHVRDLRTGEIIALQYDRLVLCTGGCSEPKFPNELTPEAAKIHGFVGPVCHSAHFSQKMDEVLAAVKPLTDNKPGHAVVVGGGRSAQDLAIFLALHDRKVSMVFEYADAIMATSSPLPDIIRKSRFLSMLSPWRGTHTVLEWFLHRTWLGSVIVHIIWKKLEDDSFDALSVPRDSPLRQAHSMFWGIRTNDEGCGGPERFHALVNTGKITLTAPARVDRFGSDGHSVILSDGRNIEADAVLLGTGYTSSWARIFDAKTMEEAGLNKHPSFMQIKEEDISQFDFTSLRDPGGQFHNKETDSALAATIYRGIVPAQNLLNRDLAVNGAMITTHNGYVFELVAHWIASYFRHDPFLRLPSTAEEAIYSAELQNAWLRKRYPGVWAWLSESYSGDTPFWNCMQVADTLLEDMDLPSFRSGGNFLTWPFKPVSVQEIANLTEERKDKRSKYMTG